MPKETYFNLPEEKREKLLRVIIDEFAQHDYKNASVSKICEQAGIAKGSFYQYFTNKKDMYRYLLSHIGESKMAYFAKYQHLLEQGDTFDFLRAVYAMGVEFTYYNPKLYAIGKMFMHLNDHQKKDFMGDQSSQSDAYLADMFQKGQAAGVIRDDLDVEFLVRMLTNLSNSVSEYYMLSLDDEAIDKDTFLNAANSMIDLLENGIKKQ